MAYCGTIALLVRYILLIFELTFIYGLTAILHTHTISALAA